MHMHTHTPLYTNTDTSKVFFETMEKWLVTHHLVLLKTNGLTVNLGTITTRKNHKKVQEYEFKVVAKWAVLRT